MRPRSLVLAAGVALAGILPPTGLALAQADESRRDRDRDGDRNRDRDGRGRDSAPVVSSISPRAGAVGQMVTVRGRFPEGAKVVFGQSEVPMTRADRRSITFAVPALPRGSHAVIIRGGGADVVAGEFRVEGGGAAPPGGPPRYKARWDRGGWVMLGEQVVQGKRDRDTVAVGQREGRFTRLMVVVEDSDLELHSMEVEFANGEVFKPSLKHFFREDDRTRAIDLPGERRAIKRIMFRYGNLPGQGRARVQIWGRDGGGSTKPPPVTGRPRRGGRPLVIDFWPREGAAGTEVTIQGRRFTPDLQIVFGDQVLAPSRSDETLLTFVVPRHRGNAPIALRRPGGREILVGTFVSSTRKGGRERWGDERRQAAERWWVQRQRKLARSVAEREAAMRVEEERLAREREARRKAHRAALRARWEQRLLSQEDVRAELALHAERTARLQRMLRLSEAGEYGQLAVRVRVLMDYENARHQQRMKDLKAAYARR
jgi:hypothetical protein